MSRWTDDMVTEVVRRTGVHPAIALRAFEELDPIWDREVDAVCWFLENLGATVNGRTIKWPVEDVGPHGELLHVCMHCGTPMVTNVNGNPGAMLGHRDTYTPTCWLTCTGKGYGRPTAYATYCAEKAVTPVAPPVEPRVYRGRVFTEESARFFVDGVEVKGMSVDFGDIKTSNYTIVDDE